MNKTSYGILILILVSIITYFSTGCNKDNSPIVTEYTIKVDSIQHSDTINTGEIFTINFYGKVGDNDCYEFKDIVDTITAGTITLELIGKHTNRTNCIDGIIYMNPVQANISGLTAGDWSIRVKQPEGITPIQDKLFVK